MYCKACNIRPVAGGKKQIKIPHPDGTKKKYEIVHEDEDLCSVCIRQSELYFNDDDDLNFSELGLDIPTSDYSLDY